MIAQRHFAVLICAATLLLRLLVPAGYMIDDSHGRITIAICSGTAPAVMTMTMTMPGAGATMPDHGKSADHTRADMPCAFAGLSAAMLGAVDPVVLATLIAFVLGLGLARVVPPAPIAWRYPRPPLRGPPAHR